MQCKKKKKAPAFITVSTQLILTKRDTDRKVTCSTGNTRISTCQTLHNILTSMNSRYL